MLIVLLIGIAIGRFILPLVEPKVLDIFNKIKGKILG